MATRRERTENSLCHFFTRRRSSQNAGKDLVCVAFSLLGVQEVGLDFCVVHSLECLCTVLLRKHICVVNS